jgi:hypothetical protein
MEKVEDFEHNGQLVPASRIGYRMTEKFVRRFFARVFSNPTSVLNEEMLKPELQDLETYVEGMLTIAAAHKEVAANYFADGSIEDACPPLKALLHIMAYGEYEGKCLNDPEIRNLFSRQAMLESDWYKERLASQQAYDTAAWKGHVEYLEHFLKRDTHTAVAQRLGIEQRLTAAREELEKVSSPSYLELLVGTIGRQPIK